MIKISEQTLFADRYLFTRLLGRGGFSEVWLATDQMTGLEIAVKVYAPGQGLDTDGTNEFCKELSQVYDLNNTYLLKPQHVDNWEGMPYLVMPYCRKGSCHRLIGTMTEEQIWKMLHDVSSGLAYLHKLGIIHQDIKPDNILVDNAGNYVITDFGISVKSRSTLRKSMNTSSGSGTTAYMGPERFSTDPMPLKASDIWSLGATAYELLTGNAPFGEIGGGLQKGGADLPTIKKNISSELRMVLSKMLSLETWDRPTADQLVHWTKDKKKIDIVSNTPQPVTNPSLPKVDSGIRKGWIIGIAVIALVLIVGGVGLYKVWHRPETTTDTVLTPIEKEKREKQLFFKTQCDDRISDLDENNVLKKMEITVKALQELEKFENDNHPEITFLQDEIKSFEAALNGIQEDVQTQLNSYNNKHVDKNSPEFKKELNKMNCIEEVLTDLGYDEIKSAYKIRLGSDNQ